MQHPAEEQSSLYSFNNRRKQEGLDQILTRSNLYLIWLQPDHMRAYEAVNEEGDNLCFVTTSVFTSQHNQEQAQQEI